MYAIAGIALSVEMRSHEISCKFYNQLFAHYFNIILLHAVLSFVFPNQIQCFLLGFGKFCQTNILC